MNNLKKEIILIKNIEQLKQIIKDKSYNNYELVEPIMIKGVKCSKPRTEPKQKPKTLRQLMLEGFDKINNRLDKQEEFNEMVLDQFKKHKWIK